VVVGRYGLLNPPCGVRSIDVKEKYIKPTRVFELEDGVGIYRNRRR
jgi:hypothetical protein